MIFSILALGILVVSGVPGWAQRPELTPGPGWKTCPRCTNDEQLKAAYETYKVDGRAFSPRDLTGVWGNNGIELDVRNVPPMTPWGQEQFEATRAPEIRPGVTASNSKDGMLICDPLGYPRLFAYNYGFEFVMLPDRVLQFFEWGHTWRTIWTDGRPLPTDPPQQRWLGYAVGRWEGDTFIVEGNGYDERSWLSEDRRNRIRGFPHSDELRTVERYKRTSYGSLEASLTIIDPKVFTQPWTTTDTIELRPNAELWEYFCVPSESDEYNKRVTEAGVGSGRE
jgi:hypothetical protein